MNIDYFYYLIKGQTLAKVGIVLDRTRVFQHGQLYSGASRVKQRESLKFLLPPKTDTVHNVVQQRLIDREEIEEAQHLWDAEARDNCGILFYI